MMTTKKFNAKMAEAAQKNRKNTVIAAGAAGATGMVSAGIVFAIGYFKNKKINTEIEKLDNKINTAVATIAIATTKPTESDTDAKRNKFMIINMFVLADAIDRKIDVYVKKSNAIIDKATGNVTTEAVYEKLNNPKLSDFESTTIYMTESDYDKMYNTAETTEEKTDKK